MIARRSFLLGLGSAIAAPAVIRTAGLLMPVRPWMPEMLRRQAILDALPKPRFVTLSWEEWSEAAETYWKNVNQANVEEFIACQRWVEERIAA